MHASDPNFIARNVLKRLAVYYMRDNLEEVVLNRPGEIWTKERRKDWVLQEAPELDYVYIRRVCRVLANINGALFSEEEIPVVSCELPGAPFRFQAIIGPNVRYDLEDRQGAAIAIRALTADASIGFASYGLAGDAALAGVAVSMSDFMVSQDHIERLREIVGRRESIIVFGSDLDGQNDLYQPAHRHD